MQNWVIILGIDILIPLLMVLFGWLLEKIYNLQYSFINIENL